MIQIMVYGTNTEHNDDNQSDNAEVVPSDEPVTVRILDQITPVPKSISARDD